jgi:dihydrofolate reductase
VRKVVLYALMSLDGVAEEPGDWMFDVDADIFDNLGEVISRQSDVLLGRGTYDYWVDYWPTSDVEPFAGFINGTPKHVFTSTPLTGDWPGTTAVRSPAADYVEGLRAGSGGDIGIHGSIRLAQSLLRAGLVDEMRLVVAPAAAHTGRHLFPDEAPIQRFTLRDVRGSATGCLLTHYAVRRRDVP